RILKPLCRLDQRSPGMRPLLGRGQPREVAIVEAFKQDRRRAACPDPLLHPLVEVAIINLGRGPAHAADEADLAHIVPKLRSPRLVERPSFLALTDTYIASASAGRPVRR